MAKRKGTSKTTSVARKQRKPLADVSNHNTMITPKAQTKRKKNISNKSSKIGESEDTYVQVKGSKGLFLAAVDRETGGVQFTPKNRKTPITFDARRHIIIKKTPNQYGSNSHSEDDMEKDFDDKKSLASASESDEGSDFDEENEKKKNNNKKKTKKSSSATTKAGTTRSASKKVKEENCSKRKAAPQSYRELLSDEEDNTKTMQDKQRSSEEELNDDWRSSSGMDY